MQGLFLEGIDNLFAQTVFIEWQVFVHVDKSACPDLEFPSVHLSKYSCRRPDVQRLRQAVPHPA